MTYEVFQAQICITCAFLDMEQNFSCRCVITAKENVFQANILVINELDDLSTKCSNDLPTGVYQLTVYDVDDVGNVYSSPAFVYHHVIIKGIGWSTMHTVCLI